MESAIEVILQDLDPSSDLPVVRSGLDRIDSLLADICTSRSAAPRTRNVHHNLHHNMKQRSQESALGASTGGLSESHSAQSSPVAPGSSEASSPHPLRSAMPSSVTSHQSAVTPQAPASPSFHNNNRHSHNLSNSSNTIPESKAHTTLHGNQKYALFYSLQNDVSYNLASRLLLILRHLLTTYRKGMLDLYVYDDELARYEMQGYGLNVQTVSTSSTGIGGTGETQRGHPGNLFNKGLRKPLPQQQSQFGKGTSPGDSTTFRPLSFDGSLNEHSDSEFNTSNNSHKNFKKYPLRYINSSEDKLNNRYNKKQPLSSSVYSTNSDDEREDAAAESDLFFHTELEGLHEYPKHDFNNEHEQEIERLSNSITDIAQLLLQLETVVLQTLDLLQGILLLHAPSRALCASKSTMLLLLELVYFDKQVAAQVSSTSAPATRSSSSSSSSESSFTPGTSKSGRSVISGVSAISKLSGTSVLSSASDRSNMGRRRTKLEMSTASSKKSAFGKDGKENNSSSKHLRQSLSSKTDPGAAEDNGQNNNNTENKEENLVIMYAPQIQIAGISTLVSAMVKEPRTIRTFESCDGVEAMCRLFKPKETPKNVKLRILEFLFFYLIPETTKGSASGNANKSKSQQQQQPNHRHSNSSNTNSDSAKLNALKQKKTTQEKSKILRKYLGNVDGLITELEASKPFGNLDNIEW